MATSVSSRTVPEQVTPAPSDPNLYGQWQVAGSRVPDTNLASATPTQSVNAQGQTVTAVPDSTTPEAPLSSFNNIPVNQLINPAQAPSAWATQNPMAQIFVGATGQVTMGHNQVVGAIADKLGIKHGANTKEPTLEAAVVAALAKQHGVRPGVQITPGKPGQTQNLTPAQIQAFANAQGMSTDAYIKQYGTKQTTPGTPVKSQTTGIQIGDIAAAMHLTVQKGQDPFLAVANKVGVNTSVSGNPQTMATYKAEAAILQVYNTPDKIQALQSQLEAAGYFTADTSPGQAQAYTPGNFDTATRMAFGALLNDTAAANGIQNGKVTGKAVTWQDMLNDQIATVTQAGGPDAVAKRAVARSFPQATESQMTSPALKAFEARLGRAPSAAELQGLTQAYDVQQQAKYAQLMPNTPVFNDQFGIPALAGIASPTQAAGQYASAHNQPEAYGHSMLNAASMIANIIGSGGPGASNIVGTTNPQDTTPPL